MKEFDIKDVKSLLNQDHDVEGAWITMNILKKLIMEPEPEPIMTPDEFCHELSMIFLRYGDDREGSHRAMDRLMCDLLESLGYKEGVEFFRKCNKWYS